MEIDEDESNSKKCNVRDATMSASKVQVRIKS